MGDNYRKRALHEQNPFVMIAFFEEHSIAKDQGKGIPLVIVHFFR